MKLPPVDYQNIPSWVLLKKMGFTLDKGTGHFVSKHF